jgi:hypothetical protein
MWTLTRSVQAEAGRSRRSPAHLGHDRKTIRAYLNGERVAGVRAPARRGSVRPVRRLLPCSGWRRIRICGRRRCSTSSSTLGFDAVVSRRSPARSVRVRLRPHCEACRRRRVARSRSSSTRPVRRPSGTGSICRTRHPRGGGARRRRCSSARSSHSGKWRGRLAESKDQPHTIDALDQITRALGGLTRVWRFDRMATVCHPGDGSDHRVVRCVSPSTTACRSRSVRRGAGTARVSSRRPTTPPPSAGGAPCRRHHHRRRAGIAGRFCATVSATPATCHRRPTRQRRRARCT